MRCSLLTLSCYSDDELDARRRGEMEAHLVGCPRCRAGLHHLREEVDRIGGLARVRVPDPSARGMLELLGLISGSDPLPPRPAAEPPRATPAAQDSPWQGSGRTGAALPWSSTAPRTARAEALTGPPPGARVPPALPPEASPPQAFDITSVTAPAAAPGRTAEEDARREEADVALVAQPEPADAEAEITRPAASPGASAEAQAEAAPPPGADPSGEPPAPGPPPPDPQLLLFEGPPAVEPTIDAAGRAAILWPVVAAPTSAPVTAPPVTATPATATPVTATPVTATPVSATPVTAPTPGARLAESRATDPTPEAAAPRAADPPDAAADASVATPAGDAGDPVPAAEADEAGDPALAGMTAAEVADDAPAGVQPGDHLHTGPSAPEAAPATPDLQTPSSPRPAPSAGDMPVAVSAPDSREALYPLHDDPEVEEMSRGAAEPAEAALGPQPAGRAGLFDRFRDRLATRRAISGLDVTGFEDSVEVVSGAGAPLRRGTARSDLARRRSDALRPASTPDAVAPDRREPGVRELLPPPARPSGRGPVPTPGDPPSAGGLPRSAAPFGDLAPGGLLGSVPLVPGPGGPHQAPGLPPAPPAAPGAAGRAPRAATPLLHRTEADPMVDLARARAAELLGRRHDPDRGTPSLSAYPGGALRGDAVEPADDEPLAPVRGRHQAVTEWPLDDGDVRAVSAVAPSRARSWAPAVTPGRPAATPARRPSTGDLREGHRLLVLYIAGITILLVVGLLSARTTTPAGTASTTGAASTSASTGSSSSSSALGTAPAVIVPPAAVAVPTPAPVAPTPVPAPQTIGSGGAGWQVQGFRYGDHGTYYRIVIDLSGGAGSSPTVTATGAGTTSILLTIAGTTSASAIPAPSGAGIVTAVALAPTQSAGSVTYRITTSRAASAHLLYLTGPLRLVVDVS